LKNHPDVGKWDALNSIEFATPHLSLVVLTVGHPPFLWTDLLTCAYLDRPHEENPPAIKAEKKWWIVHKSSECERHPLTKDEGQPTTKTT
jgi:hypothetical protein